MRRRGGRYLIATGLSVGICLALLANQFLTPSGPSIAVPVVLVLVGLAYAIFEGRRSSQHQREVKRFAERHGWEYTKRTTAYSNRFFLFPFGTGQNLRQEGVLRGTYAGAECATFTHHFDTEESRKSGVDELFQVTLVELPVILPRLELVPETLAARFAQSLGMRDLDTESYEFNRRWRVICPDARYAHAVLDPRMIERLLEPDAWDLAIRIEAGAVLAWQADRVGTQSLASRLNVLRGVARRIPEHVVRKYASPGENKLSGKSRPYPATAPEWATKPGALTTGKATGIEPGPAATGEGYRDLPWGDPRASFDIFDWGAGPQP